MAFSQKTLDLIEFNLSKSRFTAIEDFTAEDISLYKNENIAFYTLKSCNIVGESLSVNAGAYSIELECEFEIRLMGKSRSFDDFKEFNDLCLKFYRYCYMDKDMLIKSMKSGKVYQSAPLKRLERDMNLTVRIVADETALNSLKNKFHIITAGGYTAYFSQLISGCSSKFSEILTLKDELYKKRLYSVYNEITIRGKITKAGSAQLTSLMSYLNSGIRSITIDGKEYSKITLTSGECKFTEEDLLGNFEINLVHADE